MGRKKVKENSNKAPHDIENPYIPVVTPMRKKLDGLSPLSPDCCIYRVPKRLRSVKEKAYTPKLVSIGPLHHKGKGLDAMEEHKQRYLKDFLDRPNVSLEGCVKIIKDQEAKLRGCYAETFELDSDVFVSIILVDAAFIIEILLRSCFKGQGGEIDWIFQKPWMLHNIGADMLLLENQLPFFILEDLFNCLEEVPSNNRQSADSEKKSIINLSYQFFSMSMGLEEAEENFKKISSSSSEVQDFVDSSSKVQHFVDFIRKLQLPNPEKVETTGQFESTLRTPSMSKLQQAGVKFKVGSSKNLFKIQFKDGTLEIPKMEIHDYTELTLRSLIAFEQCHCKDKYISDYVSILDNLVNSPKDVELLVQNGIVANTLGDNNKVSNLINNLCIGVSWNHKNSHFAALSQDLNDYCGKGWNKSKAALRQKYFNTPWAAISVGAASILLILTITQTVCSIISVM